MTTTTTMTPIRYSELVADGRFDPTEFGYDKKTRTFAADPVPRLIELCLEATAAAAAAAAATKKDDGDGDGGEVVEYYFVDDTFQVKFQGQPAETMRLIDFCRQRYPNHVTPDYDDPIWDDEGPRTFHVQQGNLGDCGFLAHLGAIVEHDYAVGSANVRNVFSKQGRRINRQGVHSLRMPVYKPPQQGTIDPNVKRYYVFDDAVPTAGIGGTPGKFIKTNSWFMLFQKGCLKITDNRLPKVNREKYLITAFAKSHSTLHLGKLDPSVVWSNMFDLVPEGSRKIALSGLRKPRRHDDVHLPTGHAMTLTNAVEIDGYRLAQLHNPWNINTRCTLNVCHPDVYEELCDTEEYKALQAQYTVDNVTYVAVLLWEDYLNHTTDGIQFIEQASSSSSSSSCSPSSCSSSSSSITIPAPPPLPAPALLSSLPPTAAV